MKTSSLGICTHCTGSAYLSTTNAQNTTAPFSIDRKSRDNSETCIFRNRHVLSKKTAYIVGHCTVGDKIIASLSSRYGVFDALQLFTPIR